MRINKKLAVAAAIPLLIGGWALFRPELLFVNQKANARVTEQKGETLSKISKGTFVSQAHETKGEAEVIQKGSKRFLQLTNFHTSNGPDVRVFLVKGSDATKGLGKDAIDLGAIKGNIGDQFYDIPTGVDLNQYQSVSIWCYRFAVGFGAASLESSATQTQVLSNSQRFQIAEANGQTTLASFAPPRFEPVEVTFGPFSGSTMVKGKASVQEEGGKRFAVLKFAKAPSKPYEIRLVKKETIQTGMFQKDAAFVSLGMTKGKMQKIQFDKSLDLWLYRSIALYDKQTNQVVSFALLRSAQEIKKA